jgi:hypothetical protein
VKLRPDDRGNMRVVIQDSQTGRFLGRDEHWVKSDTEAQNFPSSTVALKKVEARRYGHVQIVLKFKNSTLDVVLPCKENPRPGR